MRKITYFLSTIILFVFTNEINAQLFVKDNSYVYNKGALVYVSNYVNIEGDTDGNLITGNFYLRQEGQLLQSEATVTSPNSGSGKLSVFQEGTVDNYEYNVWCSPVGNASTLLGNEKFDIGMLYRPSDNTTSSQAGTTNTYDGIANDGSANPLKISKYWIWTFRSGLTYGDWYHISDMPYTNPNALKSGEGFTMKGTLGSDFVNPGETAFNNPFDPGTVIPPNPGVPSGQRYDFRGKPNNGDITINLKVGSATMTGNPYPSAIDLSDFLTNELNCTGVAYFWEQDKTVNSHILTDYRGGYGIYSPVSRGGMGIYVPAKFNAYDNLANPVCDLSNPVCANLLPVGGNYARYFSPVGQGFMLIGAGAVGADVIATMRNSYRAFQKENAAISVFERNASPSTQSTPSSPFLPAIQSVSGFDYTTVSTAEVPQIRFNTVLGNQAIKQIVLAFADDATDGIDRAKDAANIPDSSPLDMNFLIDNKEFVISVIQFDIYKRFPVGFKSATATTSTMRVANMINFNGASEVYLYDKVTGIYHDILNQSYTFPLQAGVVNDRYEVTFTNQVLSTQDSSSENFIIVQNNLNQLLSIANPNLLDVKSVVLYDISGKLIFNKLNLGSQSNYEFNTASLSDGVYIVKLNTTDDKSVTQKIIVKKKN